ncbi:MAG TPA: MMPL family transporter, partial [Glaciihabitans sp.]|nr:MMPL family transporter [Glaciihabitans sp.]
VDIEGENLREHRLAVDWTAEQHGDAITANNVVVGSNGTTVGPLSAHVTAGSIAVVSGSNLDRTLLSATLSGRVAPLSGQLQVAGNPLPSEASRVTRHVAVANIGEVDQAENRTELGEQLIDRIRLTHPWHRGFSARRAAHEWISRAGATLTEHRDGSPSGVVRAGLTLTEHSNLNDLPQLERAVALALVALAEGTPVVIVDQSDAFADEQDEITFLSILDSLAPATTTIIFGTPVPSRARDRVVTSREVAHIDLYSFERKGALL